MKDTQRAKASNEKMDKYFEKVIAKADRDTQEKRKRSSECADQTTAKSRENAGEEDTDMKDVEARNTIGSSAQEIAEEMENRRSKRLKEQK